MNCTTYRLICNQVSQEEAYALLDSYQKMKPKVTCNIKNYHYELKEIVETKIIKADKDIVELRDKYKKEIKEV
jgi:argonaute-like protein implicated in RNA metabolism and viral defense